jgi:LysR family nitrogen assimilation transcriptional regulator
LDIRRLQAFIKIIDLGSISRAAEVLYIAQPALSQQLVQLEADFNRKLVVRSRKGVTLTAAGAELYRHAHILSRQFDRAMLEVQSGLGPLVGEVSVGLSPFSAGSTLSVALLKGVCAQLPGIALHLKESSDEVYSQLVMTGRLDMAVIHGSGPMKGVSFTPLLREKLFLIAPASAKINHDDAKSVLLADVAETPLLLPPKHNVVRKTLDRAFEQKCLTPKIVAEVDSLITIRDAIYTGIGSTVLPWSVASSMASPGKTVIYALRQTVLQEDVSLCLPTSVPETEASVAVRKILIEIAKAMAAAQRWPGASRMTGMK